MHDLLTAPVHQFFYIDTSGVGLYFCKCFELLLTSFLFRNDSQLKVVLRNKSLNTSKMSTALFDSFRTLNEENLVEKDGGKKKGEHETPDETMKSVLA